MRVWDVNANRRHEPIKKGIDLSYLHVLIPSVISSLPKPDGHNWSQLLDAGCGSGFLAESFGERAGK